MESRAKFFHFVRRTDDASSLQSPFGVMSDHNDELEISACARGEFKACLEQEGI